MEGKGAQRRLREPEREDEGYGREGRGLRT